MVIVRSIGRPALSQWSWVTPLQVICVRWVSMIDLEEVLSNQWMQQWASLLASNSLSVYTTPHAPGDPSTGGGGWKPALEAHVSSERTWFAW
jgi:hypothetical protein